eukprot:1143308-Pelagomonas_calceolata.AAC.1
MSHAHMQVDRTLKKQQIGTFIVWIARPKKGFLGWVGGSGGFSPRITHAFQQFAFPPFCAIAHFLHVS